MLSLNLVLMDSNSEGPQTASQTTYLVSIWALHSLFGEMWQGIESKQMPKWHDNFKGHFDTFSKKETANLYSHLKDKVWSGGISV